MWYFQNKDYSVIQGWITFYLQCADLSFKSFGVATAYIFIEVEINIPLLQSILNRGNIF